MGGWLHIQNVFGFERQNCLSTNWLWTVCLGYRGYFLYFKNLPEETFKENKKSDTKMATFQVLDCVVTPEEWQTCSVNIINWDTKRPFLISQINAFSQQTFWPVIVGKEGVTNDINDSSLLFKCPSEPWQCDSEPVCTIPETKAGNWNSVIINY